jgi:electron transfer flavoprotein alpha subunit
MSVLVFVEIEKGTIKKNGLEAATYAGKLAQKLGTDANAVVLGSSNDATLAELGSYGIKKVLKVADAKLDSFDSQIYTKAIADVAGSTGAKVVVVSQSLNGKAIAARLSVRLQAGIVSGAVALPETDNGFTVKKGAFSGKAFANVKINTDVKVVGIVPNSFGVEQGSGSAAVEAANVTVADSKVKVLEVNKQQGDTLPLPVAELVVSAGRGLKGPENWGIIEDLANIIGATTACSRPVADVGWRPHHEHVGQTGVAIRPNLYFAIGISGAIQHLAGVNQSKVIVVINKDPEAPFFKAADYGIIGDAFEVVPRLTEAFKKFKGA